MRDELLNETLFFDLNDTRAKITNPASSLIVRGLCRPPRLSIGFALPSWIVLRRH
jgi:hypothetical protein